MSGAEIERLLREDLKDTLTHWLKSYSKIFQARLGLTRADIINDIREQIWKGLITWDKSKKANKKTYIGRLIQNRFITLATRCQTPKFKNLVHYADVYESTAMESEMITEETPESIFEDREELMVRMSSLSEREPDREVLMYLTMGHGIEEMEKITGLQRPIIIGSIKRIDTMLRNRRVTSGT